MRFEYCFTFDASETRWWWLHAERTAVLRKYKTFFSRLRAGELPDLPERMIDWGVFCEIQKRPVNSMIIMKVQRFGNGRGFLLKVIIFASERFYSNGILQSPNIVYYTYQLALSSRGRHCTLLLLYCYVIMYGAVECMRRFMLFCWSIYRPSRHITIIVSVRPYILITNVDGGKKLINFPGKPAEPRQHSFRYFVLHVFIRSNLYNIE